MIENLSGTTVHEVGDSRRYHQGYLLGEVIGKGGQGAVYRATDLSAQGTPDETVAVKLYPSFITEAQQRAFENEGHRTTRWRHENLLPTFSYGLGRIRRGDLTHEYPVAVTDYARDGSLAQRIQRTGRLPLAEAVNLTCQAARGVQYAHDRGVTHRDLKPANFLLERRERNIRLMVGDFGIAVKLHESGADTFSTQIAVGSLPYMSPEHARGRAVRQSDIYSLAVIAYELSTGQRPFISSSTIGYVKDHEGTPPPAFERIQGLQMSPALEAIEPVIQKSLAKRPKDRHRSMGDFGQDLKDAYESAYVEERKARTVIDVATTPYPTKAVGRWPVGPEKTRQFTENDLLWLDAYDEAIAKNRDYSKEIASLQNQISTLQATIRQITTSQDVAVQDAEAKATELANAGNEIEKLQGEIISLRIALRVATSKPVNPRHGLIQSPTGPDTSSTTHETRDAQRRAVAAKLDKSLHERSRRRYTRRNLLLGGAAIAGSIVAGDRLLPLLGDDAETNPESTSQHEAKRKASVALIPELLTHMQVAKDYYAVAETAKHLASLDPGTALTMAEWLTANKQDLLGLHVYAALAPTRTTIVVRAMGDYDTHSAAGKARVIISNPGNGSRVKKYAQELFDGGHYEFIGVCAPIIAKHDREFLKRIVDIANNPHKDGNGKYAGKISWHPQAVPEIMADYPANKWILYCAEALIPYDRQTVSEAVNRLMQSELSAYLAVQCAPYHPDITKQTLRAHANMRWFGKSVRSTYVRTYFTTVMSLAAQEPDQVRQTLESGEYDNDLYRSWLSLALDPSRSDTQKRALAEINNFKPVKHELAFWVAAGLIAAYSKPQ